MDHSTPGFPVHHQLPELTKTHVHWVSDVIQPSHPLSSPSPPALNLPQHQGLFRWVSSLHQVLEFQLQHQFFQWMFSSVSPMRKIPWASYPSPSEGRQNGNHSHRKLTKLITWTTALTSSVKLWVMLYRATQSGRVMVESSGKHGPLEKGMASYFSILALRTPGTNSHTWCFYFSLIYFACLFLSYFKKCW